MLASTTLPDKAVELPDKTPPPDKTVEVQELSCSATASDGAGALVLCTGAPQSQREEQRIETARGAARASKAAGSLDAARAKRCRVCPCAARVGAARCGGGRQSSRIRRRCRRREGANPAAAPCVRALPPESGRGYRSSRVSCRLGSRVFTAAYSAPPLREQGESRC
jgi:hypothetical protein